MRWLALVVMLAAAPAVADDKTLVIEVDGKPATGELDRAWPALARCLDSEREAARFAIDATSHHAKVDKATSGWQCAARELDKLAFATGQRAVTFAWKLFDGIVQVHVTGTRDPAIFERAIRGSLRYVDHCLGTVPYARVRLDVEVDGNLVPVAGDPPEHAACVAKVLGRLPPVGAGRVQIDLSSPARFAEALSATTSARPDEAWMLKRRLAADLGAQIAEVKDSGKTVAVGGGHGSGTIGGVTGGAASPPPARGPSGRITVADRQALDEATLTPDLVLSKIVSAYMAGIKRCYKVALDKDPTARGKLSIAFTVNQVGRTVGGKATTFLPSLDACIAAQIAAWRFPVPKDKDGDPTEATFRIVLQGTPD